MWDYIIVGAGSAGCVLANRLSASGSQRILLLEAGPRDNSIVFRAPAGAGLYNVGRFDWGYQSVPDATRNGRTEHWPRGRVLGGSSSINGMIYVRGSASDFDRWAGFGNAGWEARSIAALYRHLEHCDTVSIQQSAETRGRAGELHVRMIKDGHPLTAAFTAATSARGDRFNPDYNGISQEGVGYVQLTQRRGMRCSAADAFLRPAVRRANLDLVVESEVHRLFIEGTRVTGVLYERNESLCEARGKRVILCAGSINTPKLLMLSGIGNATDLNEMGIPVVLDRKAVGDNLLEHPLIRLVYRVKVPTYNLTGGVTQRLSLLAKYLIKRQGPLASCIEAVAFLRSSPHESSPDVQLHFAPLGFEGSKEVNRPLVKMFPYPSMTVLLNKSYPVSRGRVRLASADPNVPPLIEPRLLARQEDVETMVRGIAMVRRIVATAPLAEFVTEEVLPGPGCADAESVECFLRNNAEVAYHPAGTCRMGSDADAVVAPDLKLRGMDNLWIADASIMPDLISGNTNGACMMIGEKLARQLIAARCEQR
jgi:choline dehydrogenase